MNEAQALTLEAGKYYRTRNGKRAHIAYIMAASPFNAAKPMYPATGWLEGKTYPHCWNLDGTLNDPDTKSEEDLVAEWVEPKRIKGWVNLFYRKAEDRFIAGPTVYETKRHAEEMGRMDASPLAATVEIDVLEGHGLHGEAA